MSIEHGTFHLERTYPASVHRVFVALTHEPSKRTWFADDDDLVDSSYVLDPVVGGREVLTGTLSSGESFAYEAEHVELVPDERIVDVYTVAVGGTKVSESRLTLSLSASDDGTTVVLEEEGAFFDGLDSNAAREEGGVDMLDKLGEFLK